MIPVEYLLSLGAAFIYALSVLFIKRALEEGAGIMRMTFIFNWMMVVLFAPLLLIEHTVHDWSRIWGPLSVGFCLFAAQMLVFMALKKGDVSVQTPVLGTKALLVAIFAFFLGRHAIPLSWWIGSALSALAIYFLSKTDNCPIIRKNTLTTVILAFFGAAFFGLADVIIEVEAQAFGEFPLLVIAMLVAAIGSFALVPFFEGRLLRMPQAAFRWQLIGNFLMAAEALMFYIAISFYGKATAANILYSSRGLWSVLIVWTIGHWFKNEERESGSKIMKNRLTGALLIFIAIILVLLTH